MKRRSSGSSEGSDPAHVETTQSRDPTDLNEQHSTIRRSPSNHQEQRNSSAALSSARNRIASANADWKPVQDENGSLGKTSSVAHSLPVMTSSEDDSIKEEKVVERRSNKGQLSWFRSQWAPSLLTLVTTIIGIALTYGVLGSSTQLHCDVKGCRMSYMRPSYIKFDDFDTEHTRFASKYSLYLYREQNGANNGAKVSGIPVLFIPGNAGSYKQVRPIAAETANYFHDILQHDPAVTGAGVKNIDFFTVDFNEDFTAFDGQTMLDQAEYVNEAIRYILSLYLDPRLSDRDPSLPDPTSVIVLGHSMGGIVARTILIMPNYQSNSVNTIITMSAPHARPPVTFDPRIVQIYEDINEYWRTSYSQEWENNPLWHVTLVSITGGGLDTVVPSDYAGLESIVPDTHGFTVFTSTIPSVWTSMDHQAITWCDQFRKVIARALYQIVDNGRASQTKTRAERMRVFKKWFLTGMENISETTLRQKDPTTLLTLEDSSNSIVSLGERLLLRNIGSSGELKTHLLPIPPSNALSTKSFTLLSNSKLEASGGDGPLEVLFCSVLPAQPGQANMILTMDMDLSSHNSGSTRLACKNAASDVVLLPASTHATTTPFIGDNQKPVQPFSYLQYDLTDISDYHFVAVVERAGSQIPSWVVAEFSDGVDSRSTRDISLKQLLAFGLQFHFPSERPMVTEVNIPSVQSSLLAYNLEIESQGCTQHKELFAPLVRQYLSEPYESKYFVNAKRVEVSLHGASPYMPPPMNARTSLEGISFQFWTDPTCGSSTSIRLTVDPLASLGKLYMRYRTVFASFPILIVALVLRQQFRVYDTTGVFISFSESLDICLKRSMPLLLFSLTLLSLTVGQLNASPFSGVWPWKSITSAIDFNQNDLLSGTHDPLFWFLVPVIGLICIGVCVAFHYAILTVTYILSALYGLVAARRASKTHNERKRVALVGFTPSSSRRRLVTTGILLFLVSTVVPYQFAYVVACFIQLGTNVRALWSARSVPSPSNTYFSNYVHSVFLLMFWILPINLPTLVVWIRNLTVHWFNPFSTHHNLLSVLPFVILVETLTTGKMVPRVAGRLRHFTSFLLFSTAVYAAIYGVSYAYTIHNLVNLIAAWLVVVHSTTDPWSLSGLADMFDSRPTDHSKQRKKP